MKVSVIVPSFNRRALTTRAVQSILDQTYRDFEVLVIDDASREEEVYQPAPDVADRVRVIRHRVNGGVSSARNTGIDEAAGSLVAFLDSDDYWFPTKLEEQVRLFGQMEDSSRTLLYGAYYTAGDSSFTPTPFAPRRDDQKLGDYILIHYGCLHVNTWLAARNYLKEFPFDPALRNAEDWDVILRMEEAGGRFVYCPAVGAVRNVDLREDRLTTHTDIESRRRFLARNANRLSPQAHAVLVSITEEEASPSKGKSRWLTSKLGFLLSHEKLNPSERMALLMRYTAARVAYRAREKFHRRKLAETGFAAAAGTGSRPKME